MPLVIRVYGGPDSQLVDRTHWTMTSKSEPLDISLPLEQGIAVARVELRGSGGQGMAWVHSVYRQVGVAESEDLLNTVLALGKMGVIDPRKVGLWGWSFGGFLTLATLAKDSPDSQPKGLGPQISSRHQGKLTYPNFFFIICTNEKH